MIRMTSATFRGQTAAQYNNGAQSQPRRYDAQERAKHLRVGYMGGRPQERTVRLDQPKHERYQTLQGSRSVDPESAQLEVLD